MRIIYTPKGRADEYARMRDYPNDPPLAVNLYSGCRHSCEYCYAHCTTHTKKSVFHENVSIRQNGLKNFALDCADLQAAGNRAPIFMSFLTDPVPAEEKDLKITYQAIQIAHQHDQSVNILTKGDVLETEILQILIPKRDIFGISLTCLNPIHEQEWETGAASAKKRAKGLKEAFDSDIDTRISFEPVLFPNETLKLIEMCWPYTNLIQVGKLNPKSEHSEKVWWIHNNINWRIFAERAYELLDNIGNPFYMKKDLREFLPEGHPGKGD